MQVVEPPKQEQQEQQLRTEITTFKGHASAVPQIVDQRTYDLAISNLTYVKTWRKRWTEYWNPLKDSAHKTWKGIVAKYNEGDEPAELLESRLKHVIMMWDDEQERIQREAQEKADRAAREKAEADRQAQAVEMEISGASDDEIDAMIEAPVAAVAVQVQPTYQKASGFSKRDNWCIVVEDVKALCKAIGAGKYKLTPADTAKVKDFMESLLKPQAVANQSTLNIPGCKAVNRKVGSVR